MGRGHPGLQRQVGESPAGIVCYGNEIIMILWCESCPRTDFVAYLGNFLRRYDTTHAISSTAVTTIAARPSGPASSSHTVTTSLSTLSMTPITTSGILYE